MLRGEESTVGLIGEIEQESALLASEDNDFLIRMGVSRKLLTEVMYRQQRRHGAARQPRDPALPDPGGSAPLQRRERRPAVATGGIRRRPAKRVPRGLRRLPRSAP